MTISKSVIEIDPKEIKLLDLNAHFMKHEVFNQLVANIRRDGALLGNTPFCWRLHSDKTKRPINGGYEVISGNHRVKAAIEAGLDKITIEATDDYLSPDVRKSIQLSQNLLVGDDDPATLKVIYSSIEDVEMKIYTGIDDVTLDLLESVSIAALGEANLDFQTISMVFMPDEVERITTVLESVEASASGSKVAWITAMSQYDNAMDLLELASISSSVQNTATAFLIIFEVFMRHITELSEHYLTDDYEPMSKSKHVPIETIFGYEGFPAPVAAKLKKLINRLTGQGKIKEPYEILEILIDSYNGKQEED